MNKFTILESYLEDVGFKKVYDSNEHQKKFQYESLYLIIVNQRYDGFEAWIDNGEGDKIRLDFMLEYVLSNDVLLSKAYSNEYRKVQIFETYIVDFLKLYFNRMFNGADIFRLKNKLKMDTAEFKKCLALIKK